MRHQLPEAQVVVGERRRLLLHGAALDCLLDGTAPVQPRAGAVLVPAFAHHVGLVQRGLAARLEFRQLELLPHPVQQLIDGKLHQQRDGAILVAGMVVVVQIVIGAAQQIARLGRTLAGAGCAGAAGEPEARMLKQAQRHLHAALAVARHQIRSGDRVRQMLAHGLAHLVVVPQPVARAA